MNRVKEALPVDRNSAKTKATMYHTDQCYPTATTGTAQQQPTDELFSVPSIPVQTIDVNCVWAVDQFYQILYKFGFHLAGSESDAEDLTQETYHILFTKSGAIRDGGKVKSWLFTTLYRLFLRRCRRRTRFPETTFEMTEAELPVTEPGHADNLDGASVVAALQELEEKFRSPLVMFYLEEFSYKEISAILKLPLGTIMSRLSRGKELLRKQLQIPAMVAV
jgi:RNA polymerase sigma-70 factor (ECF subfamily)